MDKEQLSALLDGELDELATLRLLRDPDEGAEGLAAWECYGLISDALREREEPGQAGCAGARRALAQIMEEPAPLSRRQRVARAARPLVPWAVAASAALVAFGLGGSGVLPTVAEIPVSVEQKLAVLFGMDAPARLELAAQADAAGDPMARYIDFHREVAAPGFERTAFVGADAGSGRGQ